MFVAIFTLSNNNNKNAVSQSRASRRAPGSGLVCIEHPSRCFLDPVPTCGPATAMTSFGSRRPIWETLPLSSGLYTIIQRTTQATTQMADRLDAGQDEDDPSCRQSRIERVERITRRQEQERLFPLCSFPNGLSQTRHRAGLAGKRDIAKVTVSLDENGEKRRMTTFITCTPPGERAGPQRLSGIKPLGVFLFREVPLDVAFFSPSTFPHRSIVSNFLAFRDMRGARRGADSRFSGSIRFDIGGVSEPRHPTWGFSERGRPRDRERPRSLDRAQLSPPDVGFCKPCRFLLQIPVVFFCFARKEDGRFEFFGRCRGAQSSRRSSGSFLQRAGRQLSTYQA